MLSPEHRALLEASAIAPEVAAARGYRSATQRAEVEVLGFRPAQARVPALVIPLHGVEGRIVLHQIRPNDPRTETRKGKTRTIKYETPRGARLRIDVPPAVRPKLDDASIPLWITEGARKADAAVTAGLACIALLGVWAFRGRRRDGTRGPLEDWDSINLEGRQVFVAFDSDVMTKAEVRGALTALTNLLQERGAMVEHVVLEPGPDGAKVGLDDFLAAGGTVEQLLACAVSPGAEETDFANAERFAADHRAEARYVPEERAWFLWRGNVWAPDDSGAVLMRAAESAKKIRSAGWQKKSLAKERLNAAATLAQPMCERRLAEFDRLPNAIAFSNGVFCVETGRFREGHRPGDFLTATLEVAYNEGAQAPTWERVLREVLPDAETRRMVRETLASGLIAGNPDQRLYFWHGPRGASGKSTVAGAVRSILGPYAAFPAATTFLRQATDKVRDDLASLRAVRMCFASEPDAGEIVSEATIKILTGGDPVKARHLYGRLFEYVAVFTPVMLLNVFPHIRGVDGGIWRRIVVVPWTVEIPEPERDPTLGEKLRAEGAGLLVELAHLVAKTKGRVALSEQAAIATALLRSEEDVLGAFLTMLARGPGKVAQAGPLWIEFKSFCEWSGAEPAPELVRTPQTFANELRGRGYSTRQLGGRVVFDGIGLPAPAPWRADEVQGVM